MQVPPRVVVAGILFGLATCAEPRAPASAMDAVLDAYTPGFRLGETVADARRKSAGLHFPAGGSANFVDTTFLTRDGFSTIVLRLALPAYDRPPADTTRIERIDVWSTRVRDAADSAEARISAAFYQQPITGCAQTEGGQTIARVRYWLTFDGGVVLETPTMSDAWTAKIIFFRGDWRPREVLRTLFTTNCRI